MDFVPSEYRLRQDNVRGVGEDDGRGLNQDFQDGCGCSGYCWGHPDHPDSKRITPTPPKTGRIPPDRQPPARGSPERRPPVPRFGKTGN